MIPNRAGFFMQQPAGYKSFVPSPLPPDPPIQIDAEMFQLLSDADRKLGRLDGITEILPNPQLFVNMYVLKEAVLSSQIEGTQASLSDVLGKVEDDNDIDIGEVSNYAEAMYYGLERLESFPMSLRLIREIHARLLKTGRGSDRSPGAFRSTQNWIGSPGCTLSNATFIPPAPADMVKSLSDLELYFHDDTVLPVHSSYPCQLMQVSMSCPTAWRHRNQRYPLLSPAPGPRRKSAVPSGSTVSYIICRCP